MAKMTDNSKRESNRPSRADIVKDANESLPGIGEDKIGELLDSVDEGMLNWISGAISDIFKSFATEFKAHWKDAKDVFDDLENLPEHRRRIIEQVTGKSFDELDSTELLKSIERTEGMEEEEEEEPDDE